MKIIATLTLDVAAPGKAATELHRVIKDSLSPLQRLRLEKSGIEVSVCAIDVAIPDGEAPSLRDIVQRLCWHLTLSGHNAIADSDNPLEALFAAAVTALAQDAAQ